MKGYTSSLILDVGQLSKTPVAQQPLGDVFKSSESGSAAKHVVIGLDLVPIADYVDWAYFEPVMTFVFSYLRYFRERFIYDPK